MLCQLSLEMILFYNVFKYIDCVQKYCGKHLIMVFHRFKESIISKLIHKVKELGGGGHLARKYTPLFLLLLQSRYKLELIYKIVDQKVMLVLSMSLLFTQDGGNWVNSHVTKFSAMDPAYSLPDNVALLTLQVSACYGPLLFLLKIKMKCLSLH